jgi:hypothetical protein
VVKDGSAKGDIKLMTAEEIYDELKRIGGDLFNHVTILPSQVNAESHQLQR